MVNQLSTLFFPFYGFVTDQLLAEVNQDLQKFMGSYSTQVLSVDELTSYKTNRLVGDDNDVFSNAEDDYNAAAYLAAWNKLNQISPTDTELSTYFPMQFNGAYKTTHVYRIYKVVNSACLYQYLVQNISSPAACADGELDNFNKNGKLIFSVLIYNATFGASNVLSSTYEYSSCGATYPYNCTTTTTTTTTASPIEYTKTLRVGVVLGDAFAVRNASAPGGYSGYAVEYAQLLASQMGASLSFHEVTVGNRKLPSSSTVTEKSLNCETPHDCQWNFLFYEQLFGNVSDIIVGLIPVTFAVAQQTLPVLLTGGQYLAGTNLLFR